MFLQEMKKNKQILLTWDAYNNGFVVTAQTVFILSEKFGIEIDEIFYLQNQTLQDSNLAEIDVFSGNKSFSKVSKKLLDDDAIKRRLHQCAEIREKLGDNIPKFKNQNVNIKSVTDYQSIYDKLVDLLKTEFLEKENIDLHINVSPGTPQMHVVWLMLNSAGFLPVNTRLWSSQWVKESRKTVLNEVKFKPKTYLSKILKSKYLKAQLPDINPNDTRSPKRKEAEEKLFTFSHTPNAPILLIGERGTGKSTYVRTIVKSIQKEKEAYAELACGTFSNELMRSELFGYKEGAFTGAIKDKDGILSKFSKGGVLFLDEIQDLSNELQRHLMQVLQTGEYYPLGATEPIKANFRLIAASNTKYRELNTKLDLDFLDRISRFVIEIPPLRECLEDIELYWKNVWNEVANFEDAPLIIWNESLEKFIFSQDLNGNFRDLQKLASYIIAFYSQTHKTEVAIAKAINEFKKWKLDDISYEENTYFRFKSTYNEIIADFNKDLAEWAIKKYGGKKEASKVLSRSESMLSKDLKKNRLNK